MLGLLCNSLWLKENIFMACAFCEVLLPQVNGGAGMASLALLAL